MYRTVFSALSPAGPDARLSVLIFHRVLPTPDPLFPDEPDATRFDAVCSWLARWFNVLPLDVAVHRLARRQLCRRAPRRSPSTTAMPTITTWRCPFCGAMA